MRKARLYATALRKIKNLDFKKFIIKLQGLSDNKKKIILWIIVAILALGMGFLWFKISIGRLAKIEESMKKIDIPSINIEENK